MIKDKQEPHMTHSEIVSEMQALEPFLDDYAQLLVKDGVAIQPGQELAVCCAVESYEFARRVVRVAYEAGAGHVELMWSDDQVTRAEYEHMPLSYFEDLEPWKRDRLNSLAERGAAFLFLVGEDPSALKGIDPKKPATASATTNRQCKSFRDGMDFGRNAWCIAGVSQVAWAQAVFADKNADEAKLLLWKAILSTARADNPDPHAAWQTHNATFNKTLRMLNEYKFIELRYSSSLGTNFVLGLNEGHIWEGGSAKTTAGVSYFPNIPTEEVFTTPDRLKAQGKVVSALPLVHHGAVIKNFWLEFKDGAVVDFGAEQGYDVLKGILDTDEGAKHLGECALISKNTPIRQSGLLFYNTLYDENASCHLALGMGFPECLEGGLEMDSDALKAAGVNQSHTHVDFMIGTDDLSIVGVTPDGREIDVFINGQWSWE